MEVTGADNAADIILATEDASDFSANIEYTITFEFEDVAGNSATPVEYTFQSHNRNPNTEDELISEDKYVQSTTDGDPSTITVTPQNDTEVLNDEQTTTINYANATVYLAPADNGGAAWTAATVAAAAAAAATTVTSATADSTTLEVPSNEGLYYLFIVDDYDNVSAASSFEVKVDDTAPTAAHLNVS